MRFLVAIAGVQLASNLLLGTASLASNPHLERRIKAMLGSMQPATTERANLRHQTTTPI